MSTNTCYRCGETKPEIEFVPNQRDNKKYTNLCKVCRNKYLKEYYNKPENKERCNSQSKQWATEHKERSREIKRNSHNKHREKNNAKKRRERPFNKEKYYEWHLKHHHHMSREEYNAKVAEQNGRCAVCGTTEFGGKGKRLIVDHDHNCCPTGDDSCPNCHRGLLCDSCNRGLGHFRDSVENLESAIAYLKKYQQQPVAA